MYCVYGGYFICCFFISYSARRDFTLDSVFEQTKAIGDAATMYEQLLSTFPTSV